MASNDSSMPAGEINREHPKRYRWPRAFDTGLVHKSQANDALAAMEREWATEAAVLRTERDKLLAALRRLDHAARPLLDEAQDIVGGRRSSPSVKSCENLGLALVATTGLLLTFPRAAEHG